MWTPGWGQGYWLLGLDDVHGLQPGFLKRGADLRLKVVGDQRRQKEYVTWTEKADVRNTAVGHQVSAVDILGRESLAEGQR